ncbi:hypothetical protein UK99_03120 [Frankia casuarinae]|uniref:hypothetical protein n=1 Tax=Frankia TaxID=1854 RepID=UPI0004DD0D88|nr:MULTISPECIES: hypothetical protein [Frankia]KEZ37062.1 hypothetical protein CEDDRAFT_01589 [Frankia sp. CeD]ORT98028.1 hypothetical protein UK99_03120 [Frankia casuarinae]
MPSGLLSVAGLAWIAGLVTAAVWVLAGLGWGLLALGLVGGLALLCVDSLLDEDDDPETRERVRMVSRALRRTPDGD